MKKLIECVRISVEENDMHIIDQINEIKAVEG